MFRRLFSSATRAIKQYNKRLFTPSTFFHASNKVIGIDLGTTFSCVAVMEGQQPHVIENSEGQRTTPSYVGFEGTNIIVGELARRQAITNPSNTIYASKRLIGRKYSDKDVQHDKELVSFGITEHANGDAWVSVDGNEMSPSQVAAYILMKMKETAESYLGEDVSQAVITVPAYFNNQQKQATKDAGQIAGLDVLRIINEPTAAAMAYGLNESSKEGIVVVFDLGGGTFDVSILDVSDGVFEVRATNGDTHLGGEDFDQCVIEYVIDEFRGDEGIDLGKDTLAIQRIKEAAEKAKIELSSTMETVINLPFIAADESGPKNLEVKITRAKFESLVEDLIKRTVEPCKICLRDAGIKQDEIKEVVLVGGMTRMPKVQETCEKIFGRKPSKGVNPDEVVACGAAIQGAVLAGDVDDIVVIDTAPLSLGIETLGGVFTKLIPKNTNIPCEKSNVFTTSQDNQVQVGIQVFQGEREIAEHNKLLGSFILDGIPPAPRGVPQVEVTFDIDANGIVNVSARDKATGREQQITIESKSGLTDEEIKNMEEDARIHAEEDQRRKDLVNLKNEADNTMHLTKQAVKEMGDKIEPADKEEADNKMEEMKSALSSDDLDIIKEKLDSLKEIQFKISEKIYNTKAQEREEKEKTEQAEYVEEDDEE